MDSQAEFASRQYANLVAGGLDEASARNRLQEVLGQAAADLLGGAGAAPTDASDVGARLAQLAGERGGSAAETRVRFIQSLAEARLFALDWWRPARTFLLYVVVLLALAVAVVVMYASYVLDAFADLYQTMGASGGAAQSVIGGGGWRLFVPLVLMAILLVLLAWLWLRMQRRMAKLAPLAGQDRFVWLYGRAGKAWQALVCLECAAALKAGGMADDAALAAAQEQAGWPADKPLQADAEPLGERLQQAQRLGTFEAELDWQRRLAWTHAQARLELWRDRLTLGFRVAFYILIGIVVTALYVPLFSLASTIGVQ